MRKAKRVSTEIAQPDVVTLLAAVTVGKQQIGFKKGEKIFSQGDPADSIYFIQSGRVKSIAVSATGKEAVLGMPGPPEFFGEGSLAPHALRISTAEALEQTTVLRVERQAMMRALQDQPGLSEKFMLSLLARNIDLEEDLCDQLFNHSEKRLARVLLKLARLQGPDVTLDSSLPAVSHETLAEMVGTTRSRANHFMNKFRAMGLIDYNGKTLVIRSELLTDILLQD